MTMPHHPLASRVSHITDSRGEHYLIPLKGWNEECPIETPDATPWERQEIERYWRDSRDAARAMIECGYHWMNELENGSTGSSHLDSGGANMPVYVGGQLVVKLTSLYHVARGYQHRIMNPHRKEPNALTDTSPSTD